MAPDPTRIRQLWLLRLAPLIVAVLVLSVFSRSLAAGFLNWDDPANFLNNLAYRGFGPGHLRWMFTTCGMGPYSPLMWLSACADHAVWGMDAFGWHLSNVLLHSANAAVFYFLCRRLLTAGRRSTDDGGEASLAAAMSALFFALHPLCVETVAWASTRPNLLLTFFYQLAILSYVAARRTGGENPSWTVRQGLPLFLFLLSLLSKGTAVTLPLVLLLLDVYPLGRLPSDPRRWTSAGNRGVLAEKVPYFALSLVFGAAAFLCQARTGTLVPMEQFGLASRAAQALYGLAFYPLKTLLPFGLLPFYQLPEGFGLFGWGTLLRGAALTGVTAAAVAVRRRVPVFTAVWAYYLLTIWPMAGIFKINEYWAADRYAYIACLGFAVPAGAGILRILRSGRGALRALLLACAWAALAGLAALTWRQQGFWRDSETLWRYALSAGPESWTARNNLGAALAERGKPAEAREQFFRAISLLPGKAMTYYNVGRTFRDQGERKEAAEYFRRALAMEPGLECARFDLALLLAETGRLSEAGALLNMRNGYTNDR